ncbi:MAG: helix-turn-helix domain-containing protein [Deltaproteobacteria bacterium]|nr:helix-turn-helix domain-containing protein [Deltaproteobacteria bacterium]
MSRPENQRRLRGKDSGRGDADIAREQLLDVKQAATMLGVRPGTLYQWAYKRRIPVVKLFGRRGALRFRLSDVAQLIQDSVRPARPSSDETR